MGMSVSWAYSPPEQLRAHHAQDAADTAGPPPPEVVVTTLPAADGFRGGLLFTPPKPSAEALIVYFHGGGFVAGSPDSHRGTTAWLAQRSGLPVLSARYRLAPEHRFPAQAHDAVAAVANAMASAGPRTRLILAGDSAGACVALWGLHALPPSLRAQVTGLVLFYGAYGLTDSPSIRRLGTPESGMDGPTLRIMYGRLGDYDRLIATPAFNPLHPRNTVMPPAFIMVGEHDPVLDDSLRLAEAIERAGGRPTLVRIPGAEHSFLKRAGGEAWVNAQLDEAAAWMKARLIDQQP